MTHLPGCPHATKENNYYHLIMSYEFKCNPLLKNHIFKDLFNVNFQF